MEAPYVIRRNAPEVRAKVTPDLYRALHREAAAEDVTVAELLRRIVTRHYEPTRQATIEQLRAVLAEASAERQLLVAMLDLMYQGLLVRLEKPAAEKLEARIADATEGHRKWRTELARRSRRRGHRHVPRADSGCREGGCLSESMTACVGSRPEASA